MQVDQCFGKKVEIISGKVYWDIRVAICCCIAICCCCMLSMSSRASPDGGFVGVVDASGDSFQDIMAV